MKGSLKIINLKGMVIFPVAKAINILETSKMMNLMDKVLICT